MAIQATKPDMNATSKMVTSNELIKSEYVLKVNNIPSTATPTSKASKVTPNNLPSTRVKNIKRKRVLIVMSLFFIFSFTVAVYLGYTATFKLYEPNTNILDFAI